MSGMQIFNAHPALYLGAQSNFDHSVLAMGAMQEGDSTKGVTTVFGHNFDTDGVLGASTDSEGNVDERGFPWSVTLPGTSRSVDGAPLAFLLRLAVSCSTAWLTSCGALAAVTSGAISLRQARSSVTSAPQSSNMPSSNSPRARRLSATMCCKAQLSHCRAHFLATNASERARHVAGMDAAFPLLLDMLGGRQSARTIHFITASFIVIFVAVHIFMVLVSGVCEQSPLDDHRPLRDRAREEKP